MKALIGPFALLAALASPSALAEDPASYAPLTKVTSDAMPGSYCDLTIGLSAANEILGVKYTCTGSTQLESFFPIERVRQGAVIFHYDPANVDVIIVRAPNLDSVRGGEFILQYLSNYLTGEYVDWKGSLEPQGLKWVAYTSRDSGHQAFNDLFAAKRVVLGQMVGIKEFRTRWVRN